MLTKRTMAAALLALSLLLSACTAKTVTLHHIHGLGYTSDGAQLLIPAHEGLASYKNGAWSMVDGPKHDYMGFVTVDSGFYSSGHPEKGSGLKDPLGVVKSADLGKTLASLDLQGVSDFHLMSVGYKNHAIYVFSDHPSAKMPTPSLYYSKDDAKTWTRSEMKGWSGEPLSLAVHPTDDKIIVLGGKSGLYLSTDSGAQFQLLTPQPNVTALSFTPTGGEVLAAAAGSPVLTQISVTSKEKKEIKLPALDAKDAVAYIAVNPSNPQELSIATFLKDVYTSKDGGATWTSIAVKGKGTSA
jgi:hypothetical protein